MKFNKGVLFPIQIYQFEPDLKYKKLAKILRKVRTADTKGFRRSNGGDSWHSQVDLFKVKELEPLTKAIIEAGTDVLIDSRAPAGSHVQLYEMWANILETGGYHNPHTHGCGGLSGVLHVTSPPDASPLVFLAPFGGCRKLHEIIPAKAGQMLIFPSWLPHYVEPYTGKESRISVSFNLQHVIKQQADGQPDYPPYVRIPKLLDKDDLTRLNAQLASAEWNSGAIGDSKGGGVHKDVRDNDVFFANFSDVDSPYHWLFQKIWKAARTVNDEQFKVDISGGAESVQFARYGPGQKYNEHTDSCTDPNSATYYRNLSVALTIADAKKGGGTSFPRAKEQPICEPGDAVFFRSDERHAALPVEEGQRTTAIVWFRKTLPAS